MKDSDSATKRRIADFLVQTFMTLDTYGRSPSQFTSIVKMFFLILDDVPVVLIEKAFERYLRSSTEFPKPAHILDIIHNLEPGVRYNRMIREGR